MLTIIVASQPCFNPEYALAHEQQKLPLYFVGAQGEISDPCAGSGI